MVWLCDNLYTTDPTLSDLNSAMVCGISREVPSPSPKSSLYTDSSAVKSSVSNVSSLNVDISTISSLAVQSHKCVFDEYLPVLLKTEALFNRLLCVL